MIIKMVCAFIYQRAMPLGDFHNGVPCFPCENQKFRIPEGSK